MFASSAPRGRVPVRPPSAHWRAGTVGIRQVTANLLRFSRARRSQGHSISRWSAGLGLWASFTGALRPARACVCVCVHDKNKNKIKIKKLKVPVLIRSKCTVQRHSVHSQCCAALTPPSCRTFHLPRPKFHSTMSHFLPVQPLAADILLCLHELDYSRILI